MSVIRYNICGIGLVLLMALPAASGEFRKRSDEESQALLKAGRAALEDGLYDVAERQLEQYLRQVSSPAEKAEGALLLARALYGQGRFNEVVHLLGRRAGWARGTPQAAGFVLWTALAHYEAGRYEQALRELKDFKARFPDSPYRAQAARLRTKCLVKLQQIADALDAFARFQENFPDSPEIPSNLLDWAGLLIRLGRKDEARDVFGRLLSRYPGSEAAAQGQLWLGRLYLEQSDWARAREVLDTLAREQRAHPEQRALAWLALAQADEEQTNLTAAVEDLLQVISLTRDPDTLARADAARGKLLIRLGKVEEGAALVKAVIARRAPDPAAGALQLELAEALLAQGRLEQAAGEFQDYLEAFSNPEALPRAWQGKGWCLWKLRRYAEAAAAFEKAFALSKDRLARAEALFKAADCFYLNQQYRAALERYRRVAEDFGDLPLAKQALYQAADALAGLEQIEEAEAAFLQLAEQGAGPALVLQGQLRVAQLREQTDRWEEAVEMYDRVVSACDEPGLCAQAMVGRGLIRYRLGQFQDALEDFERVVREAPGSRFAEQAFFMRGWSLYLLGRDQDALAVCRQFIERFPDSHWAADVLFWLGEYHFNRQQFAQAEDHFAQLAEKYPGTELADDALFWAGRSAATRKEYLRAIDFYNRLTTAYPDSPKIPEARFAQGDALSELGQFGSAILAFEEIIKKFPAHYLVDLAWGRKGDCQFTLGKDDPKRYQEALEAYRAVWSSPRAGQDLRWQAEFKMARCLEKMGSVDEALAHYMAVVYGYLAALEQGTAGNPLWFTRAAFNAAAIKESAEKWREAVQIYRRVVEANIPASTEAEARIQRIRLEHWVLF